jgi:hypothetical protein
VSYALSSTACRRRGYLDTTTRRHPPPPSELKSRQQKLSREAHPLPFEETTTGQSDPPFPCHFTSGPKQTHLSRDAHRPALPPFPSHPSRGQPINAASSDSPAPPSACLPCASPLGSTRPYRLSPRPRGPTPALLLPHHFKSHHHPRCPQTVTRSTLGLAALRCAHRTPRRRGSPRLRPDRPIDPAGGGRHGLPQPRGRGAAGRGCGGGRGGRLVLVAQRRCGSGCVVRGAGAQEGVGAAQGARVHGQGAHQPHASLCGGEAELHLPRGHPVRAARSLPCPTSRPPCYLLPPARELRPSRNLMCGARFDRMAPWLNLLC